MRAAGEIVGAVGGMAFKRFGFVQGAVVSRWPEIVGERYARVSTPESIRFPAGKKAGGTLTLLVEGAHAPLMQHLAPTITERVNRFFGYEAVVKIAFRQGTPAKPAPRPTRPVAAAVPRALGEGLRALPTPSCAPFSNLWRASSIPRAGRRGSTPGRRCPNQSTIRSDVKP